MYCLHGEATLKTARLKMLRAASRLSIPKPCACAPCFYFTYSPGLVNTKALIKGLRSEITGMACLDVYQNKSGYFFRDCSSRPVRVMQTCRPLPSAQVSLASSCRLSPLQRSLQIADDAFGRLKIYFSKDKRVTLPKHVDLLRVCGEICAGELLAGF